MMRINLLPHREAARKRQRNQFFGLLGLFAAGGLLGWGLVHLFIGEQISHQQSRNEFLKKENARLDKEIEEIKKLKEEIAALLARKQVIETLQADRSQSVQLLDELAKQTPDGVYLRAVKQEGLRVSLNGYAQSNARVSTLMRNIQSSDYIENPQLIEIKATSVNNKRLSDFNLNFQVKRNAIDAAKPAKPAAPKVTAGAAAPVAAAAAAAASERDGRNVRISIDSGAKDDQADHKKAPATQVASSSKPPRRR
jgi:type IV pilus assembly protein PilN